MSSPPPPLQILLLGYGLIGPRHASTILSSPNTTLLSIIDPYPSPSLKSSHPSTPIYPSLPSFLSTSETKPDAAIICTPNSTHVSLTLSLLSHQIPVLVEKPVCVSLEEGKMSIEGMKELGSGKGKVLGGHHRRYNPYLLSAKKCLDEGKLGNVIAVQGTWCLKKNKEYFEGIGEWRKGNETGGAVMINLIHEIDLLQYLLGPIVYVMALETSKQRQFEVEEGAAILFRFQSGVVGTFILSDNCPSPWNFEVGTGENPLISQVEGEGGFYRIFGTEGSLSVPDLKIWKGGWWEEMSVEQVEAEREKVPFEAQLEHFVKVVRREMEPGCGVMEGVSAVVVCEAVKRSMREGIAMRIDGLQIESV